MSFAKIMCLLALAVSCMTANAFVSKLPQRIAQPIVSDPFVELSSTALSERRWNFNEGQGPFGMKKNAETWNGRVAQVRIWHLVRWVWTKHLYRFWRGSICLGTIYRWLLSGFSFKNRSLERVFLRGLMREIGFSFWILVCLLSPLLVWLVSSP